MLNFCKHTFLVVKFGFPSPVAIFSHFFYGNQWYWNFLRSDIFYSSGKGLYQYSQMLNQVEAFLSVKPFQGQSTSTHKMLK